jgi:hypothetical protein
MGTLLSSLFLILNSVTGSLSGRVVDEDAKPVSGAVVVIDTGRPRRGPSLVCPSCYPECSKRSVTGPDGTFIVDELSDSTLFSLAAGASNYEAEVTQHFDPLKGNDIEIVLKKFSQADGNLKIDGNVVDLNNQPLANVKIEVHFVRLGSRGYGGDKDITPLTLSDNMGKFRVVAEKDFSEVQFRASLSGYATNEVVWSAAKPDQLTIRMGTGASLQGRLIHEGKPLANVEVGLVQEIRTLGAIVTPMEVTTNSDGVFRFEHLPPKLDYSIYTTTDQRAKGVLPVSIVTAPNDSHLADLGDVTTQSPRRLSIAVKTEDGSDLPEQSYVFVRRDRAWKSSKLTLSRTSFATVELKDVGREAFLVSPYVVGYSVLRTEPSVSPDLNKSYLVRVENDTNITFILAPVNPSPADQK